MSAHAGVAALPRPARLALLDLDGTLVDSVPDLWASADEMLRAGGRAGISLERVRSYVGNGVERLVHRCLSGDLEGQAPDDEFGPALECFNRLYARYNGRDARVYDGVREGLDRLREAGVMRACVTNKPRRFTLSLMHGLGLDGHMNLVLGGDDLARKKPAPDGLLRACKELRVGVGDSVMIGDSGNDVLAARAAGMPVLCVDYGYNHGRDIRDARPDAVASSLDDLVSLVI